MFRIGFLLLAFAMLPVQGALLWLQLPDIGQAQPVDQEFPDFPTFSTYLFHDVTVGAGGWNISSITGYFTFGNGSWPATPDVRINVLPKTGSLPGAGDDPAAGTVYSGLLTDDGTITYITAGVSISLPAGDYWIGMTPVISFGSYGQEFRQMTAVVVGDPSAIRNPGGSFGYGTAWATLESWDYTPNDGAIMIQGDFGDAGIPEPATWSLLALGIGAIAFLRRRK